MLNKANIRHNLSRLMAAKSIKTVNKCEVTPSTLSNEASEARLSHLTDEGMVGRCQME